MSTFSRVSPVPSHLPSFTLPLRVFAYYLHSIIRRYRTFFKNYLITSYATVHVLLLSITMMFLSQGQKLFFKKNNQNLILYSVHSNVRYWYVPDLPIF